MRKRRGCFFPSLLLILFIALGSAVGWYWYDTHVDRSGWEEGNMSYLDFHGDRVTGWQEIEGNRYYFDETGLKAVGWHSVDGKRLHFTEEGLLSSGWENVDGAECYFVEGSPASGWQNIDDSRYYLGSGGTPFTGEQSLDGGQYLFDVTGVMLTGWQTVRDSVHYYHPDGTMATGWLSLDHAIYCFREDGSLITGKAEINGKFYYFPEDGAMYTGWIEFPEGSSYYDDQGVLALGWTDIDGSRYYFDSFGVMQTGWLEQGEYRYYLHEDGTAATGPETIGQYTYYFTPKGIQVELVNSNHLIPDYYDPNLVTFFAWYQVSEPALEPLRRMLNDCVAAGNEYVFNSSYRSLKQQTQILEERTEEYMESMNLDFDAARAEALKTVAYPGTSEHQMGLAMDILGDSAVAWLSEHCWDYGFIVRYPEDKSEITGIDFEPWHFRYVGTEVSLDMKDSGLCLEEYLGAV